ncbi:MAG: hypothetical protein J5921_03090 [Clostridia bacterium]|nr:hypothetical protein [Clostridia bacterium]
MTKRLTAFIALAIAFMLAVCALPGCKSSKKNNSGKPDGSSTAAPEKEPVKMMDVYGIGGNKIASIPQDSEATVFDSGIFYSVTKDEDEETSTYTAEYHMLSEDGTDVQLGSLAFVGYETSYARTELGGCIYSTYTEGSLADFSEDNLYLLRFDLAAKKIERYLISEAGYPYTSVTVANGKILVMNYEQDDSSANTVYEFDPMFNKVRKVLTYTATPGGTGGMRGICGTTDGFILLRLDLSGSNKLYAERYDKGYNKVSETLISDCIVEAAGKFLTPEDAAQEPAHLVFGLRVSDDRYLFYRNASTTCAVIDLETANLLFAGDSNCEMSTGDGTPVVFKPQYAKEESGKSFSITGIKGGETAAITVAPADSSQRLLSISAAKNGRILMRLVGNDSTHSYLLYDLK